METYREHPRHCKIQRYEMELCGTVGKDAVRHQRRPTLHCEERCCEPLLDVILLQRCQIRMFLPRSHVKRVSLVRSSYGPISEGGYLSPHLPNCHLKWDLMMLWSLLSIRPVTLGGFYCCEPQRWTSVCPQAAQQMVPLPSTKYEWGYFRSGMWSKCPHKIDLGTDGKTQAEIFPQSS